MLCNIRPGLASLLCFHCPTRTPLYPFSVIVRLTNTNMSSLPLLWSRGAATGLNSASVVPSLSIDVFTPFLRYASLSRLLCFASYMTLLPRAIRTISPLMHLIRPILAFYFPSMTRCFGCRPRASRTIHTSNFEKSFDTSHNINHSLPPSN